MSQTGMGVNYDELREEVAEYVHGTRDVDALEKDELKRIDAAILDGLRRFYSPGITIPSMPHRWSFLRVVREIRTTANQHAYTMPEDFGGLEGPLMFAETDTTCRDPLRQVSEDVIRRNHSGESTTSGVPVMFCQRAMGGTGTSPQLWEIDFWPTPDAVYTLTGMYIIEPCRLTPGRPVPCGGQQHALTVKLAVKAEAEFRDMSQPMGYMQQFTQALAGSVQIDRQQRAPETMGINGRGGYGVERFWRQRGGEITFG